jgi:hypothetical protein
MWASECFKRLRDLDDDVHMIEPPAVGVQPVAKPHDALGDQGLKRLALGLAAEEGLVPVAAEHDMGESTGRMQTGFPCQARGQTSKSITCKPDPVPPFPIFLSCMRGW